MNDVNYEYLDITLTGTAAMDRLNACKQFGWEVVDVRENAQACVRLRRCLSSAHYEDWVRAEDDYHRKHGRRSWAARLLARV